MPKEQTGDTYYEEEMVMAMTMTMTLRYYVGILYPT